MTDLYRDEENLKGLRANALQGLVQLSDDDLKAELSARELKRQKIAEIKATERSNKIDAAVKYLNSEGFKVIGVPERGST